MAMLNNQRVCFSIYIYIYTCDYMDSGMTCIYIYMYIGFFENGVTPNKWSFNGKLLILGTGF